MSSDLNNNQLTTLPSGVFSNLTNLKSLSTLSFLYLHSHFVFSLSTTTNSLLFHLVSFLVFPNLVLFKLSSFHPFLSSSFFSLSRLNWSCLPPIWSFQWPLFPDLPLSSFLPFHSLPFHQSFLQHTLVFKLNWVSWWWCVWWSHFLDKPWIISSIYSLVSPFHFLPPSGLDSNHLSFLSPDVFTSLTSLKYLDSLLISLFLRQFHHLPVFNLNSNSLTSLPSELFSNLNKLNSLSFPFINPPFQWCSFPPFINQFPLSFTSLQLHHLPPFWCFQWTQQSDQSWPHT